MNLDTEHKPGILPLDEASLAMKETQIPLYTLYPKADRDMISNSLNDVLTDEHAVLTVDEQKQVKTIRASKAPIQCR